MPLAYHTYHNSLKSVTFQTSVHTYGEDNLRWQGFFASFLHIDPYSQVGWHLFQSDYNTELLRNLAFNLN